MTIEEFFAERDRRFKEVFDAEPGEQRLKAFAEFEHRSNNRYDDIESEVTLELCFALTRNRMGYEIIEMRADPEAVRKRYDEIENFYGPRMLWSVIKMVGWSSPPLCCICHSEEDRGSDDRSSPIRLTAWDRTGCTKAAWRSFTRGPTTTEVARAWTKTHPAHRSSR